MVWQEIGRLGWLEYLAEDMKSYRSRESRKHISWAILLYMLEHETFSGTGLGGRNIKPCVPAKDWRFTNKSIAARMFALKLSTAPFKRIGA